MRSLDTPLTKEELRTLRALRRLAKNWPKSLWLYSNGGGGTGGTTYLMRTGPDGERVETANGSVDQKMLVETIKIPSDGGDW